MLQGPVCPILTLFVPRCLVPSVRRFIRILPLRRHVHTLDFTNLSNDGGMGLQRHLGQTVRKTARSPFIDPTELPSFVRISEAAPLTAAGFVFDEASSMPGNMDSPSGGGTNLATVPMYNTPSNFQSLGVACMRGGTERFSFMPLSSELPGESMFSNSTERGFEEMGFDWGGQQSLFQGNEVSNDYSEVHGTLGSSSPTPGDNIGGLEELGLSSRG